MLNNTFSLSRVKLRPLAKDDLTMVLNWRNSESVRQFMLSDKLITIDEAAPLILAIYQIPSKSNKILAMLTFKNSVSKLKKIY